MSDTLIYGDISARTAAYAVVPLLKRGYEEMILEKFGQVYVLPKRSTKTAIFRRYEALSLALAALVEGVTPSGHKPTITDVPVTMLQFGDYIAHSDVVLDTHEDPIFATFGELLMQQWTESIETLRWYVLRAGTNVGYANGSQRTDVNTPITIAAQRTATDALRRQRGRKITSIVSSNQNFRTEPVEASYVGLVHSDMDTSIRLMPGFIPTKQYGSAPAWAGEIGTVEQVRYVASTLFASFPDAGGDKGAMRSTVGVKADVYPVVYLAKDAYGIVPLQGNTSVSLIVHNPGSSGSADALNQRGTIGWKTMQNSVITNDLWAYRLEAAVPA